MCASFQCVCQRWPLCAVCIPPSVQCVEGRQAIRHKAPLRNNSGLSQLSMCWKLIHTWTVILQPLRQWIIRHHQAQVHSVKIYDVMMINQKKKTKKKNVRQTSAEVHKQALKRRHTKKTSSWRSTENQAPREQGENKIAPYAQGANWIKSKAESP